MSIIEGHATREQAIASGFTFRWSDDWEVGSHVREFDGYDAEPSTCENADIRTPRGTVVGSLGCVDDADDEYRRVVESDLAAEATGVIRAHRYQQALNALYRINDAERELPPGFFSLAWRLGREINRSMARWAGRQP